MTRPTVIPANEHRESDQHAEGDRLAVVRELLDGLAPDTTALEALARLAAMTCDDLVQTSISLVDDRLQRQLATSYGSAGTVPRSGALCELMVTTGRTLCLPDASADQRYARHPHVDGRQGSIRFYTSIPLVVSDQVVGSLCAFAPVALSVSDQQLRRLHEVAAVISTHLALGRQVIELQLQVVRDPLTGVANRNILEDALGRYLSRGSRGLTHPGIVYIDVNGFKEVNDTHGHEAGDEVLQQTAQRLLNVVREADLVIRLGGDEFVVLIDESPDPATARCGITELSQRIRAQLAIPMILSRGLCINVSAAVGWALDEDGIDPSGLLHRADLAMYADKTSRNSRRVDGPSLPPPPHAHNR